MWRIIILLVFLVTGCSDEFIPFIPGTEPTTVMYGFVNVDDTINSVRITKSFYGSSSAYELASDTSELFYEKLDAKIQCTTWDSIYTEFPLVKTYIPRDTTGIFQTSKNWVYAYIGHFPPRDSFNFIRVVVVLPTGDTVQTEEMTVFSKPRMIDPSKLTKTISLYNNGSLYIKIEHYMKVGFKLKINFTEMINGRETEKSIEKFYYNSSSSYRINASRFLTILNENILDNDQVEYRRIQGVDIYGYVAGYSLLFYHNAMDTEFDFTTSPFNHIKNGTGFVLPYSVDSIMGLQFDNQTLDSLAHGEFLKKFKFVKWN